MPHLAEAARGRVIVQRSKGGTAMRGTKYVHWETEQIRQEQHNARSLPRRRTERATSIAATFSHGSETRLTVVGNNGRSTIPDQVGKDMIEQTFAGRKIVILGLARQGVAPGRGQRLPLQFQHHGAQQVDR